MPLRYFQPLKLKTFSTFKKLKEKLDILPCERTLKRRNSLILQLTGSKQNIPCMEGVLELFEQQIIR